MIEESISNLDSRLSELQTLVIAMASPEQIARAGIRTLTYDWLQMKSGVSLFRFDWNDAIEITQAWHGSRKGQSVEDFKKNEVEVEIPKRKAALAPFVQQLKDAGMNIKIMEG